MRSSCVRGRGTEKSADDLVGPPEMATLFELRSRPLDFPSATPPLPSRTRVALPLLAMLPRARRALLWRRLQTGTKFPPASVSKRAKRANSRAIHPSGGRACMRLRMLHDGESGCMSHDNSGQHTTWPPLSDKARVRSLARPRSRRVSRVLFAPGETARNGRTAGRFGTLLVGQARSPSPVTF